MLSMLEEVVLLAVDEKSGGLRSTREFGTAYALVGAVFFALALAGKIDDVARLRNLVSEDSVRHAGEYRGTVRTAWLRGE
jgi:hypothetical protein